MVRLPFLLIRAGIIERSLLRVKAGLYAIVWDRCPSDPLPDITAAGRCRPGRPRFRAAVPPRPDSTQSVAAARRRLAPQGAFAQANRLRRHLDQLVVGDPLDARL